MPRQARDSSGTGIYHVMMRGINHQNIFEEQEDYYQFLNTLDIMAQSYEPDGIGITGRFLDPLYRGVSACCLGDGRRHRGLR